MWDMASAVTIITRPEGRLLQEIVAGRKPVKIAGAGCGEVVGRRLALLSTAIERMQDQAGQ